MKHEVFLFDTVEFDQIYFGSISENIDNIKRAVKVFTSSKAFNTISNHSMVIQNMG